MKTKFLIYIVFLCSFFSYGQDYRMKVIFHSDQNNEFNELLIIQQGERGIDATAMIRSIEKAIVKDPISIFNANKKLWEDMNIDHYKKLENLADKNSLSTKSDYLSFQNVFKTTEQ